MRWSDGTDLGSIESVGSKDNKWNFQFLSKDRAKLPKNIAAGSTAYELDTKKMYVLHAESQTWYEM